MTVQEKHRPQEDDPAGGGGGPAGDAPGSAGDPAARTGTSAEDRTAAPAEDRPTGPGGPAGRAAPADGKGDPFDRDALPAPKGATGALLRSLLAPRRAGVAVSALLLLLQQAAVQAGPLLVAYAIDRAVPALRQGNHGPVAAVAAGYAL